METKLLSYIHKHTVLITLVVVGAFLALAFGEYILYRKIMLVNQMVSEGFMQMKEINKLESGKDFDSMMEELKEGMMEKDKATEK
ncbi:hypothetical protein HY357_03510 [Candidatus Roizmanbacteria bacterium]|nr:hypothetical protein [Candidatus Roizmanbacteria bacterium]